MKKRLKRYKYLSGSGFNEKIAKQILKCLRKKEVVKIFAFKPEENIFYKGIKIDTLIGFEGELIKVFNPKWNKNN